MTFALPPEQVGRDRERERGLEESGPARLPIRLEQGRQ